MLEAPESDDYFVFVISPDVVGSRGGESYK
jgi:hypothetical protein